MMQTAKKVGFQTGHQDALLSHAFGLYAFPTSETTARVESLLNEAAQRLNEAELRLSVENFGTLEGFR